MGYSGDQPPNRRKFDANGNLIDPEDVLFDSLSKIFSNNQASSCFRCKHLNDDEVSCKAYPNVIPREILVGEQPHDKPYKGDNGIQFEEDEELLKATFK